MRRALHGKVVVVTGASSGVGRAVARAFGQQGAKVALLARGEDGLAAAQQELGDDALALSVDVSDDAALASAAERVVQRFGQIDIWVNNAMVSVFAPTWDVTPAEFRRVTDVTYLGYVFGTQCALRHMRPRNQGLIIQIGSALAYRSIPLQSAYCAAKAAARGFTDSLRSELLHEKSKVKLMMVQLPAVNTPQFDVVRNKLGKHAHPVPPLFEPQLIADAVVRAAMRPKREVWLGAPTLQAIVGQRLFPGLLDRYLARFGWDCQMTDALPPHAEDNLDAPIPGDRGARGPFSKEARSSSALIWMRGYARELAGAVGLAVALGAALRVRRVG